MSVDPGVRKCGVAVWRSGALVRAYTTAEAPEGEVPPELLELPSDAVWVVETPRSYPVLRVTHRDVARLRSAAFAIETAVQPSTWRVVYPADWKGQMPKRVCRERIRGRLAPEELDCVAGRVTHDAWDAVGVGLWALGRFR